MADPPPSYERALGWENREQKPESRLTRRFSIREEVGVSRSQHVMAVVAKLLPHIENRARGGLSKSTFLLLPSDQDSSRKGELVGFRVEELPVLVQLEGEQDTVEFWSQPEALDSLRGQVLAAISDTVPTPAIDAPPAPREPLPRKTSYFGRKPVKPPGARALPLPMKTPVAVEVHLDDVSFRTETEYGLYQTLSGRAVVLTVEVS
ncbi:hypothetical protein B0A55_08632 [Friedmanniomyces simplex]|uniref:Uncharacterized protein n=1 Tax=Friedmanniomyces simplex TaxID=329884 RepID=A0A4U0WNU1_9PEZI|nr:hypothetical protein B0A55_08632 [Friedmanniomyces simplex]